MKVEATLILKKHKMKDHLELDDDNLFQEIYKKRNLYNCNGRQAIKLCERLELRNSQFNLKATSLIEGYASSLKKLLNDINQTKN